MCPRQAWPPGTMLYPLLHSSCSVVFLLCSLVYVSLPSSVWHLHLSAVVALTYRTPGLCFTLRRAEPATWPALVTNALPAFYRYTSLWWPRLRPPCYDLAELQPVSVRKCTGQQQWWRKNFRHWQSLHGSFRQRDPLPDLSGLFYVHDLKGSNYQRHKDLELDRQKEKRSKEKENKSQKGS